MKLALAALWALAALVLAPAGFEATDPAALQFSLLPARAVAGQAVTIGVSRAHSGAACSLGVDYAGTKEAGLPTKTAVNGHAAWSWTIPQTVQADFARLDVACAGSKRLSGRLLVVGSLVPPRMSVVKDGFSVRTSTTGSSDVSYGVILENRSPNADALNVSVLVNFVMADNHLLGSASNTVALIPAGSTYALGSSLGFPGAAPITRLEIVIQVGSSTRHAGHPPGLDTVVIEPSTFDQGFVGDVAGEVVNTDMSLVLQSTHLSAVVFDAAGNVIGGGSGSSYGALPPGTRMIFKISSGFRDIPFDKAASVQVSAIPTWQPASTKA
jgi:hypothetical protein